MHRLGGASYNSTGIHSPLQMDDSDSPPSLLKLAEVSTTLPVRSELCAEPLRVLTTRVLVYDEASDSEAALPWILRKDPLNGGYKYIVLFASTVTMLAFSSVLSGSVYIIPLEDEFSLTRSDASLFVSLSLGIFCAATIFISKIADRIGMYATTVIGYLALCLGYFVPSFLHSYGGVLGVYIAFIGLGAAALQMMPMLFVQDWFEPQGRVGFALGVSLSAVGLGNIVMTLYMEHFIDTASWRVSLRYMALLTLALGVVSLAALRARALHPHRQRGLALAAVSLFRAALHGGDAAVRAPPACCPPGAALHHCLGHQPPAPAVAAAAAASAGARAGGVTGGGVRHELDCSYPGFEALRAHADVVAAGPAQPHEVSATATVAVAAGAAPGAGPRQSPAAVWLKDAELDDVDTTAAEAAAEALHDGLTAGEPFFRVSMFYRPRFVLFFVAALVGTFNFYLPTVHLVPHAEDMGVGDPSFLLIIMGIVTICSRIIFGLAADRIGGVNVYTIACTLQLALMILWRYSTTTAHFQAVAAMYGCVGGAYIVGITATIRMMSLPIELSNSMDWVLGVGFAPGATLGGPITGWAYAAENENYVPVLTGFTISSAISVAIMLVLALYKPRANTPRPPQPRAVATDSAAVSLHGGAAFSGDDAARLEAARPLDAAPAPTVDMPARRPPLASRIGAFNDDGSHSDAHSETNSDAPLDATAGATGAAALSSTSSAHTSEGDIVRKPIGARSSSDISIAMTDGSGSGSGSVAGTASVAEGQSGLTKSSTAKSTGTLSPAGSTVGEHSLAPVLVKSEYMSGRMYISRVLSLLRTMAVRSARASKLAATAPRDSTAAPPV